MRKRISRLFLLNVTAVCLTTAVFISLSPQTSAHQSGCHRWHSCPSDSGSYVCGDLGYTSGCGSYEEYYVDYFALGGAAGIEHVSKNSSYIIGNAEEEGTTNGTSDGEEGEPDDSSTDASDFCSEVNFQNQDSPQDYYDGFMDTYTDGCLDLYNEHYATAYESAYKEGEERHITLLASEYDTPDSSDSASDSSYGWLGLLALGGFIGFPILADSWNSIKKWWSS